MNEINDLINKYESRINEIENDYPDVITKKISLNNLNDNEKEYFILRDIISSLRKIKTGGK